MITADQNIAYQQNLSECWGEYLEAVVINEPPYDDRSISDLDHFSRRVAENVSFFEEEFARGKNEAAAVVAEIGP